MDEELLGALRAREVAAWDDLYRSVYAKLRNYASSRVGPDDADDVVNETMLRAVRAIGRYRPTPAGIDPWLFGIARRVVGDHQRRAARANRPEPRPAASVDHADPGEKMEATEEGEAVRRALGRLSSFDRRLLELRVLGGLSVEEAAAALGKRPGAIRTAQSRALAKLRAEMGS